MFLFRWDIFIFFIILYKRLRPLQTASLFLTGGVWCDKYHEWIQTLGKSDGPCSIATSTIARFGNDISCAEGDTIQHGSMCTLRCPQLSNLAPTFAELECRLGELPPPGFLLNAFWSDYDKQNGFQINCAGFLTISRFLERILMEHIDMKTT